MGSTYFHHESASARLSQLAHPNLYLLTNLFSHERGKGHANGLLKLITEFADSNQLSIFLEAQPYGRPVQTALSTMQLVTLYEKHGFEIKEKGLFRGGVPMVRWYSHEIHAI